MALNRFNENLNDALETYFPEFNPFLGFTYRFYSRFLLVGLRVRKKLFGGRVLVNERIVEYSQIVRWLNESGIILDIGCVSSRLPIQLASLGYEVHGLDTRSYDFKHPNFHFHQSDLFNWIPEQRFDVVILLSALEHFGLGGYNDRVIEEADKKAITRIAGWLEKRGQLLVSVPFGQPTITRKHRVYDMARLHYIFSDFEWVEQSFFERVQNCWFPTSPEKLKNVSSETLPCNGVAILNLKLT